MNLWKAGWNLFLKNLNTGQEAATRVNFLMAESVEKHWKPFIDGELIKDCMIAAAKEILISKVIVTGILYVFHSQVYQWLFFAFGSSYLCEKKSRKWNILKIFTDPN